MKTENEKRTVALVQLKAIAHPARIRILQLLSNAANDLSVNQICFAMKLPQPVISQHLNLLKVKGILSSRKEGLNVFYKAANPLMTKITELLIEASKQ